MIPANYSYISFPFLGLELNPPRVLELGPLTVHYYGAIIAVGLMLGMLYCLRRGKEFGLEENDILDGFLWITPLAIVCARIYYCIFSWDEYAANPISVLYIWNGGIAIYGSVIGAILGMAIFAKVKKVKLTSVLDLVLMAFLIGQFIGRWGNFMNREAFGAATDSYFRMGLFNTKTNAWEYYHPTFLYESVWNMVGFVLLHLLSKKRRYDGQMALCYAAWYGLGRCMIEGLRVDSLWWGPFRVSQVLAGITCIVAVALLVYLHFKPHDPAKMWVNQVAAAQKPEEKTE